MIKNMYKKDCEKFSNEKIIYHMKLKGYNPYILSKYGGIPLVTLIDILKGRTTNPRINTLYIIAEALDVDISDLI